MLWKDIDEMATRTWERKRECSAAAVLSCDQEKHVVSSST